MKFQVIAAFLIISLLSLEGARAAPNSGSFDGNNAGRGSMNDNGNGGTFNNNGGENNGGYNNGGDNTFNGNGNTNDGPVVWY